MRCRGQWSDVIAALLVGVVLITVVWSGKHMGRPLGDDGMLWADAAAGLAFLLLQRVLARR